jgi:hypothetical protein
LTTLLDRQVDEVLEQAAVQDVLACESALCVAAATLARSDSAASATRLIREYGRDDPRAIRPLAEQIAEEFGLEAEVRLQATSFAVRFHRP